MLASRSTLALAGALAAACVVAPPSWASAASCAKPGYSYGGLASLAPVHGVRATITTLASAEVEDGHVAAWVGVGRSTVRGKRGLVRVGLIATSGSADRLYYEVRGRRSWRRHVGPPVAPGRSHRVAVREMRARTGWWRIWIDRRAIGRPLFLGGSRGALRPMATAETWDGGQPSCNRFKFGFKRIAVANRTKGSWERLSRARVLRDFGFELTRSSTASFIVANREVAPPTPPPAPPPPSGPAGFFKGDWESGGYPPWTVIEHNRNVPLSDQFSAVTSPVRQGVYAGRFTVRPGDKYGGFNGERVEVALPEPWQREKEGDDLWYAWSTLFPTDWTVPAGWGYFVQWHSDFPVPPPVAFNARGDTALLYVYAGTVNSAGGASFKGKYPLLDTLSKGLWQDFLVHIRWSFTDGAITVWHRLEGDPAFTKIFDLTGIPNLQMKDGYLSPNFMKHGLYRGDDPTTTNTVYHDGFHRGLTLEEVAGAFGEPLVFSDPVP